MGMHNPTAAQALAVTDATAPVTLSLAVNGSVDVPLTFRTPFPAGVTDYKITYHILGLTASVLAGMTVTEKSRTNAGVVLTLRSAGVLLAVAATVVVDAYRSA